MQMAPNESNNTNCYYCSYIAAPIASCTPSLQRLGFARG